MYCGLLVIYYEMLVIYDRLIVIYYGARNVSQAGCAQQYARPAPQTVDYAPFIKSQLASRN